MAPPIRTRPSLPLSESLPSGSFHKPLFYPSEGRQSENHSHRKLTNLITWTTALPNSVELWAMPCRDIQDGRVMVESSDETWSTGEGDGQPLQHSCLESPMNSPSSVPGIFWLLFTSTLCMTITMTLPINRRWKQQEVREFLGTSSRMENLAQQISASVRGFYLQCKAL